MKKRLSKNFNQFKEHKWYKQNTIVALLCLVMITSLTIGYATLMQTLGIQGNVMLRADADVRIVNVQFNPAGTTCGYDNFHPKFSVDTFTVNSVLPELDCVMVYNITIRNRSSYYIQISDIIEELYNNGNIIYEFSNLEIGDVILPNETITTQITFRYRADITSLPENTSLGAIIRLEWTKNLTNPNRTDVTVTFIANGAEVIGAQSLSCSFYRPATSCNLVAPTITRNGYAIIGWNSQNNAVNSGWNVGANRVVSQNETWYAITREFNLRDQIFENNTFREGSPNFAIPANNANRQTEEGIWRIPDNDGNSYIFRGTHALNNNVIFAGHQWKIIRIDGAGNVRMVYNGICPNNSCNINGATAGGNATIGSSPFNTQNNRNRFVGFMFGVEPGNFAEQHANTNNSTIKTFLDNWFNNLPLAVREKTVYTDFCADRTLYRGHYVSGTGLGSTPTDFGGRGRVELSRNPSIHCPRSEDIIISRVGLPTIDEVAMAGGVWADANPDHFLRTNQIFWTMSPRRFTSNIASTFDLQANGSIGRMDVAISRGVRPIISLSYTVIITSGDGSAGNPFVIQTP